METDSESLLLVIREYESVIETLTSQVQFYANEQEHLRQQITTVIKENRTLAKTINDILNSQSRTTTEIVQKPIENDLIVNLKRQLDLLFQEKESATQLWQNSLKNTDRLEEELRFFQNRTHGFYSKSKVVKIKENYETEINDLKQQLSESQSKINNILTTSAKTLEDKNAHLEKALKAQHRNLEVIKNLEIEVKQLQTNAKEIIKTRDKLQATLYAKSNLIEKLKIKDLQAKSKVTEAVQIVEAAFYEKDASLLRENKAKEEVAKISKTLSDVIDDTAENLKIELENVQKSHNSRIKKAHEQMAKIKEELNVKDFELNKYIREKKFLEEQLERAKTGNILMDESCTSKLLILEKNLESTFQKLLLSEKQNVKLTSEKESTKADLEQMASCFEADIKTREVEKRVLGKEVCALKRRLKISNSNLIRVSNKMNKLNMKIKVLDTEMCNKLQLKDVIHQDILKKTMEAVENKNETTQTSLQTYLELEIALNKKWKNLMQDIMCKFENRMKELKGVNKSLKTKLQIAINETVGCRKNLSSICKSVININAINKNIKNKR